MTLIFKPRTWLALALAFALATWMASCGTLRPAHAQTTAALLEQKTTAELQRQYETLNAEILRRCDPSTPRINQSGPSTAELESQADTIGAILTARNRAEFSARTAKFNQAADLANRAAADIGFWAHRKYCRRTLWRRLSRYREPGWCTR